MFCIIFFALVSMTSTVYAFDGVMPYETTRLRGQSGAGVGALLVNESTLLNPAAIVFTNQATLLYEKGDKQLDEASPNREKNYRDASYEGIIITDQTSAVRGGVRYGYQREAGGKRVEYAASLARALNKNSSLGVIISHNQEESLLYPDKTFTQLDLGYTAVISESLILGAVIKDLSSVNEQYNYATLGVFYSFNEFIDLMADIGSGDFQNQTKKSFNKWALQLQSFERFYLRYGRFYDQNFGFKGFSYGLSWVGPKFSIDYAYKTSEKINSSSNIVEFEETLIETSFALTTLF